VGRGVVRLGQIGYLVKGVAFAIVGGLFGWAAITYDPEKAGGLDDALRTVDGAPFAAGLLTLMALGLACFGVYCFCLGAAPEGLHRLRHRASNMRRRAAWAVRRRPGMTS